MGNLQEKLNKLNRCLELPDGLLAGGTHIELQSDRYAIIDGKCSVLQYSENEIKINTGSGIVTFRGRNLTINSLNKSSATITGVIYSLSFKD